VQHALFAIAEPRRAEILRLLWNQERAAGDIASQFNITFGAVSQHLRVLRDAELVDVRRAGKQRIYRARKENLGPLADYLEAMWSGRLALLKTLAEAEENAE
jgi:DNA-binding transcriptional ArsR family regulator